MFTLLILLFLSSDQGVWNQAKIKQKLGTIPRWMAWEQGLHSQLSATPSSHTEEAGSELSSVAKGEAAKVIQQVLKPGASALLSTQSA